MADGPAALIAVCVNDTAENQRWRTTVRCLTSLGVTARLTRHELVIIDNGSTCPITLTFLDEYCQDHIAVRGHRVTLLRFAANQHATYAFNHVIHHLLPLVPDRIFVRMENDIEILTPGWPERFAALFDAAPRAGAISTKPFDLPGKGQDGVPLTIAGLDCLRVAEVPGYCTAFRPGVMGELGALVSAGPYIEDVLTSARLRSLGWELYFTQPDVIVCYHVDRSPVQAYADWKHDAARAAWTQYVALRQDYESGTRTAFESFVPRDAAFTCPYLSLGLRALA